MKNKYLGHCQNYGSSRPLCCLDSQEYDGFSGQSYGLGSSYRRIMQSGCRYFLAFGATGLECTQFYYLVMKNKSKSICHKLLLAALAAFAITEANAGSDASAIETTATKDGDFYVLNGTKQWITMAEKPKYTLYSQ